MLRAIYPGSFDPVTNGHIDIIRRAAAISDELIVGVLQNKAKSPLFSVEERVIILREVTKNLKNVKIIPFEGLLIDFAAQMDAKVIVRGLRAITDFEYELQMSQTNRKLNADIETLFLTTSLEYSFLSSTTVKEVASFVTFKFSLMQLMAFLLCSTKTALDAPLLNASMPIPPLPLNKSRKVESARYSEIILNKVSLIRSVVGLVSRPSMVFNCILFALPAITRMILLHFPAFSFFIIDTSKNLVNIVKKM